MFLDSKIVHVVAEKLKLYKPKIIVLDPVMIGTQ
jgi:hydroxymethylpyrimidine/phosphomethylpyrimidine kinase